MSKKVTDTQCTVEGNFNRYIFEAKDSDYFISSIILKPESMKNLRAFILNSDLAKKVDDVDFLLPAGNDIILKGASETFKKEMQDRVSEYSFTVKVVFDEKYQKYQLDLIAFFEKIPTTEPAMVKFLSKKISTIGKVTAQKIVSHFGIKNVEDIFNYHPEKLLEVNGIKESQLEKIKKSWNDNKLIFEILSYLKDFEITDNISLKIFNTYNKESLNIIKTNPYQLSTIEGVSFLTADKIALKNGFEKDDAKRIMFGINYVINDYIQRKGHTVIHINKLLTIATKLLELADDIVLGYINFLIEKEKLVKVKVKTNKPPFYDDNYLTNNKTWMLEKSIFDFIVELSSTNFETQFMSQEEIEEFEKINEFNLDEEYQLKAVSSIFKNKTNVLTGGPGTGKTTTIKAIVKAYERKDKQIALLAPTGKASQKLAQSTNKLAETLHKFLKILPGVESFEDDNEYLKYDLIIIDESSMLDLPIMYQLLKRVNPYQTSLLFVGDIDQLPPVGMGYFFRDIIRSGLINLCKLGKTHRISEDSSVAINAHNVINSKQLDLKKTSDFEVVETSSDKETLEKIQAIYQKLLDEGNSILDIQVLSPVRENTLSCKEINKAVRPIANSNFNEEEFVNSKIALSYIIGDKVMQKENNYELMVFNGDTGIVKEYDIRKDKTVVEFGDPNYKIEKRDYEKNMLNQLELAYCITIHKSQGSDYPYVIIPLSSKHSLQWNKSLLYTAMTRTKKKLFLVGNKKILKSINERYKNEERITNLMVEFEKMNKENVINNEQIFE